MGGIVSTALPVLEYCNPSFNKINSEPDPTLEKNPDPGLKIMENPDYIAGYAAYSGRKYWSLLKKNNPDP